MVLCGNDKVKQNFMRRQIQQLSKETNFTEEDITNFY